MTISQKRTVGFPGKARGVLGEKNQDKRQCLSSAYLEIIFRLSAAYVAAYLEVTETILRPLKNAFGSTVCLKKIVHPGASCEDLRNVHKCCFCARLTNAEEKLARALYAREEDR